MCQAQRDWIALDAEVFDERSPQDNGPAPWPSAPLEWLWSDHPVDSDAPHDVAILGPQSPVRAGAGDTAVEVTGIVHDRSPVESIEVEMRTPAGTASTLICRDSTPTDGTWSCAWLPRDSQGISEYELRARATDSHGHVGACSAPFTVAAVDSMAPSLSIDPGVNGQLIGRLPRYLTGTIVDEKAVGSVNICSSEGCARADLAGPAPGSLETRWSTALPMPVDGVPNGERMDLEVHAIDASGNRSPVTPVTYRVDKMPRQLTVIASDYVPGTTLATGRVADNSPVSVYAHVISPDATDARHKARREGDSWSYALAHLPPGTDRLLFEAADAAGDRAWSGPYDAHGTGVSKIWAPFVSTAMR